MDLNLEILDGDHESADA